MQLTRAPERMGSAEWQVISPGHRVIAVCRTHAWSRTSPSEPPDSFWENSRGKIPGT